MDFDFTDLILLVGTNPLPNYVVAKYFLKHNSSLERIWLVYSEEENIIKQSGTLELAQNIKEVIKEEFQAEKLQFEGVALSNVGSAPKVQEDMRKKFGSQMHDNSTTMHLNYTGGTKSMAVHVYRYIENNFAGENTSFSYLDGRNYRLSYDDKRQPSNDLRKEISLSLYDLIRLHGYEKEMGKVLPEEFKPALEKFKAIIEQGRLPEYFRWKEEYIRKKYYENDEFIEKREQFLKYNCLLDDGKLSQKKVSELKQNFREDTPQFILDILYDITREKSILDEDGSLWIPTEDTSNKAYNKKIGSVIKDFLDGKWLEEYVEWTINAKIQDDEILRIKQEKGAIDIGTNWVIWKGDKTKNFEIDVIIVNGYQICGISCTTSDKKAICKSKGFEIIHRMRQVGGDEALSILVSCMDDLKKETVSEELEQMTGTPKANLLVLGIDDLKPDILWKKIKKYIWGDA